MKTGEPTSVAAISATDKGQTAWREAAGARPSAKTPSATATAPARPGQERHDFVKYRIAITPSESGITISPSHSGTPNGSRLPSMRSASTTFTAA